MTEVDERVARQMVAQAANRAAGRLTASEAALQRHVALQRKAQLGAGMALPPRHRSERPDGRSVRAPALAPCLAEAPPVAESARRLTDDEVRAAVSQGMQELWAAVDRVRLRRASMEQYAATASSHGQESSTQAATMAPTAQRRVQVAAAEMQIEIYTQYVGAGRRVASEALRVAPVVEHMRRRGQLGEAEERAAERFYRDFVLGHRVAGLVSSYGDRIAGSDRDAGDDLRAMFHNRFIGACRAIGHWPTIEWMVRIVCEQIMASEASVPTLADAGRAYLGYRNQQQAQAVGATLVKSGLERLVPYYRT